MNNDLLYLVAVCAAPFASFQLKATNRFLRDLFESDAYLLDTHTNNLINPKTWIIENSGNLDLLTLFEPFKKVFLLMFNVNDGLRMIENGLNVDVFKCIPKSEELFQSVLLKQFASPSKQTEEILNRVIEQRKGKNHQLKSKLYKFGLLPVVEVKRTSLILHESFIKSLINSDFGDIANDLINYHLERMLKLFDNPLDFLEKVINRVSFLNKING